MPARIRLVIGLLVVVMLYFSPIRGPIQAADPDPIRIAVLKFGTVNWELDTILHNGLDKANGFTLEVKPLAGSAAAKIAFEGGEADILVSDWIWVARRRATGADLVFLPYSKSVGGVMVAGNSPAQTLADLKHSKIAIAGGPLDKSWLILQAYALKNGMDLKTSTEQVFGAPPLLHQKALTGEFGGIVNFWHYLARLEAKGFRTLVSVNDAARDLGLDPDIPLLGYVMKGDFVREHADRVRGFAAASRAAKKILEEDDTAWERLRPIMKAEDDAAFEKLKAGFRAGIPDGQAVDPDAAARFFNLMAQLGGEQLVGTATTLPDGVFVDVGGW
ncbi:ABC transporter substrate-binding protein [Hwanghaeella grinnelliae]|uniref:ABC transporter substrate-binding protein n=1 Tax=Hwanghaeella grinnelliae TaxID=2500179 RepID=A0A437QUQ7_9PROT|nr:ABC transporter substrate-binding protein [Hwanghaeella grinnelliae]RVU38219.1 ABC transporter substrate-binding protein [Hwanghaeella grinnelliae]